MGTLRAAGLAVVLAVVFALAAIFGAGTAVASTPAVDRVSVDVAELGYRAGGDVQEPGFVTTDSLFDGEPDSLTGRTALVPSAGSLSIEVEVRRVLGSITFGTVRLVDSASGLDVLAWPTGTPVRVGDGIVVVAARGLARHRGSFPRLVSVDLVVDDRRIDAGNHAVHFELGGLARLAVVHVPPGLAGSPPALIALPGLIETHWMVELFGKVAAHSDAHGYLAVFAAHHGVQWAVKGDHRASYIDDEAYVDRLLDTLEQRFGADPTRIYATGMSNGGFFTNQLACDRSDRIAAFAPVSGPLGDAGSCRPGRTVPIVMLHGTNDPLVPYDRPLPFTGRLDAPHTAAFWAARNGCGPVPVDTLLPDVDPDDGTRVVRHEWTGCPADAPVVLYEIQGGGHNWPGAIPFLPPPILGGQTYDIVANDVVWDFVSRFNL